MSNFPINWDLMFYNNGAQVRGFCTLGRTVQRPIRSFLDEINNIKEINQVTRENGPVFEFTPVSSDTLVLRWDNDNDVHQLRGAIMVAIDVASANDETRITRCVFDRDMPGTHGAEGLPRMFNMNLWPNELFQMERVLPPGHGVVSDSNYPSVIGDILESRIQHGFPVKPSDYSENTYPCNKPSHHENLNSPPADDTISIGEAYDGYLEWYGPKVFGHSLADRAPVTYDLTYGGTPISRSDLAGLLRQRRTQDDLAAAFSNAVLEGEIGGDGSVVELVQGVYMLLLGDTPGGAIDDTEPPEDSDPTTH